MWRGLLGRNLLKKSSIVYPLRRDSTVLVSGLVTYCMMSVLLNCSEVNFLFFFLKKKHVVAVSGPAVEARLAPSPATRSHAQTPQGPFPTAPRGEAAPPGMVAPTRHPGLVRTTA